MAHVLTQGLFDNDTTCDVTSRELEVVTPSVFQNTLHLPVQASWIELDRTFATAMAGTVLLMLGSMWMVLASLRVEEVSTAQRKPAPALVAPAPTEADPQLHPAPPVPAKRAMHAKRKVRKLSAKPVRRNKLANRPVRLQKRASTSR